MNRFAFDLRSSAAHLPIAPTSELSPRIAPLDEANRATLCHFLATVANSVLKVKILQIFLGNPGIFLSSPNLADRVASPVFETCKAVQQLAEAGALNYCPHFASADLCYLSLSQLTKPMQLNLAVLLMALREQSGLVWDSFDNQCEKELVTPPQAPSVPETQQATQQATHTEATTRRACLNELPALIAAEQHGGRHASQGWRCQKGALELSVPVLESECPVPSSGDNMCSDCSV